MQKIRNKTYVIFWKLSNYRGGNGWTSVEGHDKSRMSVSFQDRKCLYHNIKHNIMLYTIIHLHGSLWIIVMLFLHLSTNPLGLVCVCAGNVFSTVTIMKSTPTVLKEQIVHTWEGKRNCFILLYEWYIRYWIKFMLK